MVIWTIRITPKSHGIPNIPSRWNIHPMFRWKLTCTLDHILHDGMFHLFWHKISFCCTCRLSEDHSLFQTSDPTRCSKLSDYSHLLGPTSSWSRVGAGMSAFISDKEIHLYSSKDSDYMRRLSCQKMFWLLWQYQQYCHNAHGKLWHYRHVVKLEIFFPNIWGFLVVLGDI